MYAIAFMYISYVCMSVVWYVCRHVLKFAKACTILTCHVLYSKVVQCDAVCMYVLEAMRSVVCNTSNSDLCHLCSGCNLCHVCNVYNLCRDCSVCAMYVSCMWCVKYVSCVCAMSVMCVAYTMSVRNATIDIWDVCMYGCMDAWCMHIGLQVMYAVQCCSFQTVSKQHKGSQRI